MFLSAVSVLVVAQSSSEIPEGLTNNPVHALNIPVSVAMKFPLLQQAHVRWDLCSPCDVGDVSTLLSCDAMLLGSLLLTFRELLVYSYSWPSRPRKLAYFALKMNINDTRIFRNVEGRTHTHTASSAIKLNIQDYINLASHTCWHWLRGLMFIGQCFISLVDAFLRHT